MLRDVIAVQVVEPYRLRLRFDDGIEGEIDVAREISFSGVFEPLKDAAYFRQVRVDANLGTIVWPNGADLDPIVLYARVTGQPLPTEKRPVTA
jgi:hypothetical protein